MNNQTPIKMLLVDDKSLTTSLDRAGYREMGVQVLSASDQQEAFNALENKAVEIVVINLDFLGSGARMICHTLRNREEWKEMPIVVTSVQASSVHKSSAIDAGANLFVEQPIPRSYFIQKIKELLTKATRGNDRIRSADLGPVKLICSDQEYSFPIGDISSSGMLVSTEKELDQGVVCSMEIRLPNSKKPIKIDGEVVRVLKEDKNNPDRKAGLGIRFSKFKGDAQKKLTQFLDKHSSLGDEQMQYYL